MCGICGCGEGEARIEDGDKKAGGHAHHHAHDHHHDHAHDHHHHHHHDHAHDHDGEARVLQVELDLLAKNNAFAADNRRHFDAHGILALNLVSSPGSGKTALLVKSIEMLGEALPVCVIEGDQQTSNDADRIRATGAPAIQINTGKICHLDAHMIGHAAERLAPADGAVLFIENVGNLVCPAGFDLGEAHKVVILSVTEGEDKPLKYPDMFAAADLVLINKTDLLPYVDFDIDAAIANARRTNPTIKALKVSARSGEGLADWIAWIKAAQAMAQIGRAPTAAASASAPVAE